jgi:hypothetical protein
VNQDAVTYLNEADLVSLAVDRVKVKWRRYEISYMNCMIEYYLFKPKW